MEEGVPVPSIIEISNSGVCNRECSFCPRSDPSFEDKKEFIDAEEIKLIINYNFRFRTNRQSKWNLTT